MKGTEPKKQKSSTLTIERRSLALLRNILIFASIVCVILVGANIFIVVRTVVAAVVPVAVTVAMVQIMVDVVIVASTLVHLATNHIFFNDKFIFNRYNSPLFDGTVTQLVSFKYE
jgi:hypothetical protein